MSGKANVAITGTENLKEIFDKLPLEYRKPVMQRIFIKASAKFIRTARSSFNGSATKGVGFVNGKSSQYPAVYAGLIRKGNNNFSYLKAFWRNFGTLANRDSAYQFRYGRKTKSAKWRGGITSTNTVGQAWQANQQEADRIIQTESAAIANKFLMQKAKRK